MIVLDARYVRERPSGIGAMVDELVRRVPELMPDERFVFLRHPKARSPLSTSPNTRDVVVAAEANGPATAFFLGRVADLSGARLFHAPFNILPRGLRMPTVVTIHDLMWLDTPELCRSPGAWGRVETAFYGTGIRHALARATRILAPSHATARAIQRRSRDAFARTVVVPHGVDPVFAPEATPSDEAVRRRYVPAGARYVLTVGQSVGYKNHAGAVRAFVRAFADDPSVHLVLLQRLGRTADALVRIARERGAGERVHVLPALPLEDLVALYRGALCLLHPSFVEGWGMPVSEALAAGCPVVTSDRSSMPEVTGDAGLLVDPESERSIADALARLAGDAALASDLRARGLRRAAELSWDAHARATARVYEDVLRGVSPR